MIKILMIMGVASLAFSGRADTLLLSDNFNTTSGSASGFNNTLSTDQGGTLKPVTYTLAGYGADWQIQHGNAGQMLLAGQSAGGLLYASLNHNFATEANSTDAPLKIQFNIRNTTASTAWATIAVGSAQNAFVNDARNKFSSLFRGTSTSPQDTQQFAAGTDLGANFTFANNDLITLVLSDAAGTGSAFNGNATVKVYVNGSLKYTKTGLNFTASDGYISFQVYYAEGYYDNLAVSLLGTKTVTYSGNGSTSGTAPTDGTIYDSGALVTVLGNPGSLAKAGYNFAGWNTQADGNGTTYAQGSTFTISANTTLYAKWTTGYAVTYSGNGNTGGTAPSDNNIYSSGSTVTVLGNTGSLTKTGHTFTGWTNSSGTHYAGGDTFSIVAASTLFAEWTINQYTLTYNAGANGTLTGTTPQTVNYGASGTAVTAVPSAGYRFVNWSDGVGTASRTDASVSNNLTVTATFDNNLAWNNGAATGNWNTTDTNWTGVIWVNGLPDNAVFSHTASPATVTLAQAITAGSVMIGNGGNNANYTFISGPGGSLQAASLILQAAGANDPNSVGYPTTTLSNANISISGNIGIGRGRLTIGGNSVVTADQIGGSIAGVSSADWGILTIQDNAVVTATNGVNGDTTAWGLNLNGGMLITSGIRVAPLYGNTDLKFNGALVKASADNATFVTIQTPGWGWFYTPSIGANGVTFDTQGHNIGLTITMTGVGGLTKTGNGTLTISGADTYTGNTTISGGTLALSGSGSISNSANIVVAGNAIFNVSGLSSAFTLGSQTLSNSAPGAIINGTNNCSTGTVSLVYDGVNPSFTITNGGMALSAATTLEVNNTAAQLPHGTNKLIARATGGDVGLVTGTLPAVTISGGGAAAPVSLQIVSGELYLNVNNPPMANAKSYSVAQGGIITIAVASGSKSLATDVDGDTLTVISLGDTNAVDFGGAGISGSGTGITYTNTSGAAGSIDLFSYTVTDGYGGRATNSVSIRIDSATGANLVSAAAGGGNAYLTYAGIPGTNYALDHATSITPPITWTQEELKPAGSDGMLRFTNLLSSWPTNDFYRTRYVP